MESETNTATFLMHHIKSCLVFQSSGPTEVETTDCQLVISGEGARYDSSRKLHLSGHNLFLLWSFRMCSNSNSHVSQGTWIWPGNRPLSNRIQLHTVVNGIRHFVL
uniref:Uncharacterized protein n=1 Tax=Trichobilharzia regenti TaxID=157069 RepID=A0AA85J642_TRIRE|nr:unnamed protein product [Trichobilharzia regenti]